MLGSLKFAVLQFANFHFPQNPRIARTPCKFNLKIELAKVFTTFYSKKPKIISLYKYITKTEKTSNEV